MKKMIGMMAIALAAALAFTACDNGGGGGTGHTHTYSATWSFDATQHWHECTAGDGAKSAVANHTGDPCTDCGYDTSAISVTFSSVTADGSATVTTTTLTLTFSEAITGLSASDISLSGVTGVTKGTLSGSGPTYTLGISGFTAGGSLSVAVSKSGYNISGSPKPVTIYYYTSGSGHTHTWGEWQSDATQHWKECIANDGAKGEVANHDYDTDFVCTVCEYEHTHSYSATWSHNATQHWKECICGEKSAVANHAYGADYVCADCGYVHTHSYSAEWSYDYSQHWHKCACGAINDAASHTGNPCTICGNWNWTAGSSSSVTSSISTIAYGSNTFVGGNGSGEMQTSADGINWTAVTNSTFDNKSINGITYGNNTFVAVGYQTIAYSTNGTTWTVSPFSSSLNAESFGTGYLIGVAYGGSGGNAKFVVVGNAGKMATSSDGASWTAVTNTAFTNSIRAVAYGNNRWVAGGNDGKMAYSTDGTTWTAVSDSTFPSTNSYDSSFLINAIAYGNGKFVAGGWGGSMAYADW